MAGDAWSESTPVRDSVMVRTLRVAAQQIGGPRKLSSFLGANASQVNDWLTGAAEPPSPYFLKSLELILDQLDRRQAGGR